MSLGHGLNSEEWLTEAKVVWCINVGTSALAGVRHYRLSVSPSLSPGQVGAHVWAVIDSCERTVCGTGNGFDLISGRDETGRDRKRLMC